MTSTAHMMRDAEPAEREQDLPNAMLDAFEAQVRVLVDAGLELQLRTRVDRLLGAPRGLYRELDVERASVERASAASGPAKPTADPLVLAGVLVTCRSLARFKLTSDQHAAIDRLRAWVLEQIKVQGEPA